MQCSFPYTRRLKLTIHGRQSVVLFYLDLFARRISILALNQASCSAIRSTRFRRDRGDSATNTSHDSSCNQCCVCVIERRRRHEPIGNVSHGSCHPLSTRRHSDGESQNQDSLSCNTAAKSEQRASVLELHAIFCSKYTKWLSRSKVKVKYNKHLTTCRYSRVFFSIFCADTQRHADTRTHQKHSTAGAQVMR